jgi:hypothetical protein
MIPLVIDSEKIKALREYAEANRVPLAEMYRILNGQSPCVGDRPNYSLNLDFGFRLVFSVEEHPRTDGGTTWGRHMSVSLTEPSGTRVPSIHAVQLLCMELGFKPWGECMVNFNQDSEPPYVEVFCELEE